jgi:hypothetical protein
MRTDVAVRTVPKITTIGERNAAGAHSSRPRDTVTKSPDRREMEYRLDAGGTRHQPLLFLGLEGLELLRNIHG